MPGTVARRVGSGAGVTSSVFSLSVPAYVLHNKKSVSPTVSIQTPGQVRDVEAAAGVVLMDCPCPGRMDFPSSYAHHGKPKRTRDLAHIHGARMAPEALLLWCDRGQVAHGDQLNPVRWSDCSQLCY